MKKLLMILGVICAAFSFYAQTEKYNDLISIAEQHKAEEHWVYAMAFYADAIAEDPSYAIDAFDKFNEIAYSIFQGNPGIEIYSEDELYYRWKNILTETETYWTENCPYTITIGPLELKSESKGTVSYWSDISVKYSDKYILIMNAVEQGYKKAYNFSWDLPMPVQEYSSEGYRYCSSDDFWPRVSVTKGNSIKKGNIYSLTTKPEDFIKNNAATIGFSSNGPNDYEPRFEHGKHLKIFTDKAIGEFYNAFAYHEPQDILCNTLYEAKVALVSINGGDVTPSSTFLLKHTFDSDEPGFRFEINDIPDYERENYENGSYYPVIYDLKLHYGFQTSEMYNKPKGEKYFFSEKEILSLPSLSFNDEKLNIYYSEKGEKDRLLVFYFSNLYKNKFNDALSSEIIKHETDKGYTYYLSDSISNISYDDDFIEIEDTALGKHRVPLWILANYCSEMLGLQCSYDKYGNHINDSGFLVSLNDTYDCFTLKLNIEMSEEQKAQLAIETQAEENEYNSKTDRPHPAAKKNFDKIKKHPAVRSHKKYRK